MWFQPSVGFAAGRPPGTTKCAKGRSVRLAYGASVDRVVDRGSPDAEESGEVILGEVPESCSSRDSCPGSATAAAAYTGLGRVLHRQVGDLLQSPPFAHAGRVGCAGSKDEAIP
jgi:hypothetical protein